MIRHYRPTACVFASIAVANCAAGQTPPVSTNAAKPHNVAATVFEPQKTVMFQSNFSSSGEPLKLWNFSEDDRYDLATPTPERMSIVDAPHLTNTKAVRFFVNRAPNSFRAEISLPSENGWNERWYAERILLPDDWVVDPSKARTLVMQWHGIPGNFRATFPNLDIAVHNNQWVVTRSFGDPKTKPTRDYATLGDITPGAWVSWVVHARWSPDQDGLVQIWKDGKLVFNRSGPNVYGTIGVKYTPYLKTGIYHPFWHITGDVSRNDNDSRAAFDAETASNTPVKNKTIYVADLKIGNEHATYKDVAPPADLSDQ